MAGILVEAPASSTPHTGQAVFVLGRWYQIRKVTVGGKDVVLRRLNDSQAADLQNKIDRTNEVVKQQRKDRGLMRSMARWFKGGK